ncbi:hypothetical protein AMTR_s00115p00122280, partial [Amborella trichopoda]
SKGLRYLRRFPKVAPKVVTATSKVVTRTEGADYQLPKADRKGLPFLADRRCWLPIRKPVEDGAHGMALETQSTYLPFELGP